MGKYYGTIGYGETVETRDGVWETQITKRKIFGDVIKNSRRLDTNVNLNDNISVSNRISFLSDPYARKNFHLIKYISYMGALWKVISVEEEFPRLILTLGGVYNDDQQT